MHRLLTLNEVCPKSRNVTWLSSSVSEEAISPARMALPPLCGAMPPEAALARNKQHAEQHHIGAAGKTLQSTTQARGSMSRGPI